MCHERPSRPTRRSSQRTARSGSTAAELPSEPDQDRWESASGSLASGSRPSRDASSSPSVRNLELAALPEEALDGAAKREGALLSALDEAAGEGGMQDALQSAPSVPSSCGSGGLAATAATPAGAWPEECMEAAAPLVDRECADEESGPEEVGQRAGLPARPPLVQYSVEIVRCRVLCPDWRDTAFAPGTPREAGAQGGRGALLLDVPYSLLQMPAHEPAQHPGVHPVQEHCSSSGAEEAAAGASGTHPAIERQDDGGCAADESRQPHALIFSGRQLGFRVEVFDPGKGPAPLVGAPFLSIPGVSFAALGPRPLPVEIHRPPACGAWSGEEAVVPAYEASIQSVALVADPGQLQVLRAALQWGQTEHAHVLGRTEQQAVQAAQPRASGGQRRGWLSAAHPCSVAVRLEQALVRLRGRDAGADPSLMLQARGLAAHACALQLPRSFAGGAVSLVSALVSVAGVPPPAAPPDAAPAGPEPKKARKALFGRSASAPASHLTDMPVPPVSALRCRAVTDALCSRNEMSLRSGFQGHTMLS